MAPASMAARMSASVSYVVRTRTRGAPGRAVIAAVAWEPSMPAAELEVHEDHVDVAGRRRRPTACSAVADVGDDLEVRFGLQDGAQPGAYDGVVVGEQQPDGGAWRSRGGLRRRRARVGAVGCGGGRGGGAREGDGDRGALARVRTRR